MNTKKMIQSIVMLGVFWYSFMVWFCIFELHLNWLILLLLTILLGIFIKVLYPLSKDRSMKHSEVDHHGI